MTPLKDNFWLLPVTGLLPPLLQLWPLPEALMYWRPLFPLVFVAFWTYISPVWMGGLLAFIYGFVVEQMAGLPIGSYAISCAVLATIIKGSYARFRIYSMPQKAAVVALIMLCSMILSMPVTASYRLPYYGIPFVLCQVLSTSLLWLLVVSTLSTKVMRLTHKHV